MSTEIDENGSRAVKWLSFFYFIFILYLHDFFK
jgi:hypothetical protein